MIEHLDEDQLARLTLSPESTPSIAAVQHLESCGACRARVTGVQQAMRAVDAMWRDPAVADAERARAIDTAFDRLAAELRHPHLQRPSAAPKSASRASRKPAATALASFGARLAGIRVLFPIAASALLAFMAGRGDQLAVRVGLECASIELASAALLLGAVVVLARRVRVSLPPTLLASVSGTGALLGHVWLHTHCEARLEAPHLFAFHTGAVILAAALAPLARRLLPATR